MDYHEEHSDSSDPEYLVNVVNHVSTVEQDNKSHSGPIYVEVIIVDTKQPVKLQVDYGEEINVISKKYIPIVKLEESSMTLQNNWNNLTTKTIGKTRLIVRNSENKLNITSNFKLLTEKELRLLTGRRRKI